MAGKRIVFLSLMDAFPWGGSEELWYRTALAAVDRGFKVMACVRKWEPEHPKILELRKRNVMIVYKQSNRKLLFLSRIIKRFFKTDLDLNRAHLDKIERFAPDVLVISLGNTMDFFSEVSIYNFTQHLRKPYFVISQFNGEHGGPISQTIFHRIKTIKVPWEKFYFVSLRNLLNIQRLMTYHLPNTAVVGNPVNIAHTAIFPWPTGRNLALACVARFDTQFKGQDILIETLAEPEFKAFDFTLDLFGSGPHREFLERLVDFYGLGDRVKIVGQVSDLDTLWASHHALVLPSLGEGTPLVLQECMLKGRPAVATDVGGNHTLVVDGTTGFLVPVASVTYLKTALLRLMNTPMGELRKLGENAFHHARAVVDPSPEQTILADIEKIIQIKNGPPA